MEWTCDFIRTLAQLYRRLYGRQTRIFQLSSTMRGGKPADAALPPLASAVKSTFQFSSSLRGGKLAIAALPPLSSAVKSIFQFSSALRGGKLEIASTLRVHVAEIFQSDFLSFFRFFCLLVAPGSVLSSTKWWTDMCGWEFGKIISNDDKNTINRMSLVLALHFT